MVNDIDVNKLQHRNRVTIRRTSSRNYDALSEFQVQLHVDSPTKFGIEMNADGHEDKRFHLPTSIREDWKTRSK